jgi:hypothetical protein
MEKEFVPYELALALKELGFDEPCFGFYYMKEINLFESCKINERRNSSYVKDYMDKEDCSAPTFSQAFRWFRENHGLWVTFEYGDCDCEEEDDDCKDCDVCWYIGKCFEYGIGPLFFHELNDFKTLEEAELECLKKLIEIVKEKK